MVYFYITGLLSQPTIVNTNTSYRINSIFNNNLNMNTYLFEWPLLNYITSCITTVNINYNEFGNIL